MENPADHLAKAWREFGATLGQHPDAAERDAETNVLHALAGPMQAQAALFEDALRMFREEQISVREHLLGPLTEMIQQFEDVAKSLRASGEALVLAGELMDQQATAMESGVAVARQLQRTMAWTPHVPDVGGAGRAERADDDPRP